jgi:hypothetical protein
MANVDKPFGMHPTENPSNRPPRLRAHKLETARQGGALDNDEIFIGQPLALTGYGEVDGADDVTPSPGTLIGVAAEYRMSALAGNDETDILVWDDPDQEFEIQAEGTVAQTHIFTHCDFKTITGGDSTTHISTCELDQATSTSDYGALKVIQLSPRVGNALGANAKLIVKFHPSVHWLSYETPVGN